MKTAIHILGLSKSMQFGTLLSYHSEEAVAPEPPKALVFFLGVTVMDMLNTSRSREQESHKNTCTKEDKHLPAEEVFTVPHKI